MLEEKKVKALLIDFVKIIFINTVNIDEDSVAEGEFLL